MKSFGRIRGVLLAMLGSLGVGLILCRLAGYPFLTVSVVVLSGALGALAGAFSTSHKPIPSGVLFGLCALTAVADAVWCFGGFRMPVAVLFLYLLSFGALMISGFGFYGPLGVWSTILTGLSVFAAKDPVWSLTAGTATLGALVLTLDGFRDNGMRKSQLKKREHKHLSDPSGILGHSYMLTGIFLLGAVLIGLLTYGLSTGLIQGIKTAFTEGAIGTLGVFRWIAWAIEKILQWFSDLFPNLEESPGGAFGSSGDYTKEIYFGGPGSWLATAIMVAIFVMACAGICALVAATLLRARKPRKEDEEVSDYEEEIEALTRPKFQLRRKKKLRQRYQDMTTPAMKIRFVFQQMLRHKSRENPTAYTKTPNELLEKDISGEETLVNAYNRVKYAQGDVTPEELSAAEQYLNQL